MFALAAAFGSICPPAVLHLGAGGYSIWSASSVLLIALFAVLTVIPVRARMNLPADAREQFHAGIWRFGLGGNLAFATLQVANVAD